MESCTHAVVGIAFQQSLPLQKMANALVNRMRQLCQFLIRRRLDPLKPGGGCVDATELQIQL